jgi:hypothetical protein
MSLVTKHKKRRDFGVNHALISPLKVETEANIATRSLSTADAGVS